MTITRFNLPGRRAPAIVCGLVLMTMVLVTLDARPARADATVRAYIADPGTSTVKVLDTATNTVSASIPMSLRPEHLVGSPDGRRVYVADSNDVSGVVSVIDTATNTVTATIPVGGHAAGIGLTPDGSRVYVSNARDNTVSVIDTATDTVSATIGVGDAPLNLAVSADGGQVYVTNRNGNNVSVISTATSTVTTTISLAQSPSGIAASPTGGLVYVTRGTLPGGSVTVIDTTTNTIRATIAVGGNPQEVTFSPDGARAYVANLDGGSNSVSVIDTATSTVVATVGVGGNPYGVASTPDGAHVYVVNRDTTASVIDTATNTVVASPAITGSIAPTNVTIPRPATVSSADLRVAVSDSPDPVAPGATVTYTVAVTNNGPSPATGVLATTTLSGAARTIMSATPSQGSCTIAAPTVTCAVGALRGTGSATVTIAVRPTAAGTLTATANVTGTEPDPVAADNTAAQSTTVAAADIEVDLGATPSLGILASSLRYTLTVHNTGPSPVTSATVTATLPAGAGATNLSTGCTTAGRTVTCTYGAIASGASAQRSFRVPLSLLALGRVTVTAVRTASAPTDPNPANDSASASCTVVSILLATCP